MKRSSFQEIGWTSWTICKLPEETQRNSPLLAKVQNILKEVELSGSTSESKISELESFIGSSAPEQRDILPPKLSNTKGSGK